jgi:hypothetical protein
LVLSVAGGCGAAVVVLATSHTCAAIKTWSLVSSGMLPPLKEMTWSGVKPSGYALPLRSASIAVVR